MSLGLIYLIDRANRFRTIAATTLYFLVNTFMRCFLHSWRAPVFIFRVIPMVFVLLLFIVWIFLLFLFLLFLFFSNCGPNTWSRAGLGRDEVHPLIITGLAAWRMLRCTSSLSCPLTLPYHLSLPYLRPFLQHWLDWLEVLIQPPI